MSLGIPRTYIKERLIQIIKNKGDVLDACKGCPLNEHECTIYIEENDLSEIGLEDKECYELALNRYVKDYGEGSLVEELI